MNKTLALSGALASCLLISGCSRQAKKKPEDHSFDELKDKTLAALNSNKNTEAIAYLEFMATNYSDHQKVASYRLMLADLYYKSARYPEAFEIYTLFHDFYPSDPRAEYAYYRSVLCKNNLVSSTSCDDAETKVTLRLCEGYLRRSSNQKYRDDVDAIVRTCRRRLIDKEVYVYNFYLGQGKYKSAKNRIEQIRKLYLENDKELEPRLLYLEGKLASKQREKDVVKEKVMLLVDEYPDSQFTRMARGLVTDDKGFFIF